METGWILHEILREVKKAVVGKDEVILKVLLAGMARGHVLLEDLPGVGKTTLAVAFSQAMGLPYKRVQFTPDVMPADLTGFTLFRKETGQMEYQPGALMCSLFLADELNRASSRTQSALLEAMEEGKVSVDGTTHQIPRPFWVIATQNPEGAAGTQRLPDSQVDRFLIRLSMGYPDLKSEAEMVRRQRGGSMEPVRQVAEPRDLEMLQHQTEQVYLSGDVLEYILRLIDGTWHHSEICRGASPRATLALTAYSQAMALAHGRDYVIPEDVVAGVRDVLEHRMIYGPRPENSDPLGEILGRVKAPRLRR